MIFIDVIDINDEAPEIISPSDDVTILGFPTNEGLQKVVGPVIKIEVSSLTVTKYFILFPVRLKTGKIFETKNLFLYQLVPEMGTILILKSKS